MRRGWRLNQRKGDSKHNLQWQEEMVSWFPVLQWRRQRRVLVNEKKEASVFFFYGDYFLNINFANDFFF
jgi:hypothetical protein